MVTSAEECRPPRRGILIGEEKLVAAFYFMKVPLEVEH